MKKEDEAVEKRPTFLDSIKNKSKISNLPPSKSNDIDTKVNIKLIKTENENQLPNKPSSRNGLNEKVSKREETRAKQDPNKIKTSSSSFESFKIPKIKMESSENESKNQVVLSNIKAEKSLNLAEKVSTDSKVIKIIEPSSKKLFSFMIYSFWFKRGFKIFY